MCDDGLMEYLHPHANEIRFLTAAAAAIVDDDPTAYSLLAPMPTDDMVTAALDAFARIGCHNTTEGHLVVDRFHAAATRLQALVPADMETHPDYHTYRVCHDLADAAFDVVLMGTEIGFPIPHADKRAELLTALLLFTSLLADVSIGMPESEKIDPAAVNASFLIGLTKPLHTT